MAGSTAIPQAMEANPTGHPWTTAQGDRMLSSTVAAIASGEGLRIEWLRHRLPTGGQLRVAPRAVPRAFHFPLRRIGPFATLASAGEDRCQETNDANDMASSAEFVG